MLAPQAAKVEQYTPKLVFSPKKEKKNYVKIEENISPITAERMKKNSMENLSKD